MSWQIGVGTGGAHDQPILDVLGDMQSAGFAGVELGTPPRHFDPWRQDQVDAVGIELRRCGIAAVSIHAPFGGILDLSEPNAHHRHAAIGGILQAASVVKLLGGDIVVVHPTDVPRTAGAMSGRLETAVESLATLGRACRRLDLRLAVESPLPHLIGGHPDEFGWILGRLDDDIGVCLDTGHLWLGGHWDAFLALAGSRLAHVHASDNRGSFDDHLPPGDGVIAWDHVAGGLRHAGYRGWIVLEIGFPNGDRRGTLARARHAAQRWFG
jgi:sugar phosphate isomerase/epimerase